MQSWFSWLMPGTVQFLATNSDDMYAVTKQDDQFVISKAVLSQAPEQGIIVNSQGEKVNPCVDMYATASSVVYDSATKTSKCYLPDNDVTTLDPIIAPILDPVGPPTAPPIVLPTQAPALPTAPLIILPILPSLSNIYSP